MSNEEERVAWLRKRRSKLNARISRMSGGERKEALRDLQKMDRKISNLSKRLTR